MVSEHTSRLAASWAADPSAAPWHELNGSAVLADLSGFTRLTEALTGTGAEGVEVLHRVMTLCFTTLLGPSIDLGGDVIGFAGDAALVWFDGGEHVERAVSAAAAMPSQIGRLPVSLMGGKRLRVSVGVHTGTAQAIVAGSTQRAMFLCGPEVSLLAALQSAATPGEVLMSPAVAARVRPSLRGATSGPGVVLERRGAARRTTVTAPPTALPDVAAGPILDSFLSRSVRELIAAGVTVGDHRTASVGFVLVPGIDGLLAEGGPVTAHRTLEHVVDTVTRVCDELSVDWLDVDVGIDSVKLLLTAGAPRSIGDDEDRLLLALRRILDECDHPLRAGGQRGRIVSGPLGVSSRRTYTVLGDPVNVAARALGLAADRQLVVGDGLDVAGRSYVDATPLGPRQLRNRNTPIEMWRVDAVHDRPVTGASRAAASIGLVRAGELQQLIASWKAVTDSGCGAVVSVVGEPGMGASELLAEVADTAGGAATILVADPFRRHVPYSAVRALVRELAVNSGSEVGDGGWTWFTALVPQLPAHLRRWAPDALATVARPGAADGDPQTVARRTQLVLAALIGAGMPRPWLLVVDDVDLIDAASRQVIGELRAMTVDRPLLLVASSTPGAAPFPEPFPATAILLEPIADPEARSFVIELAPSLRDDQVERIIIAGSGNPLVLSELARHPQPGNLPDSLLRLGATLVDTLPAPARLLARDASIFGSQISVWTVAEVLGRPGLIDPDSWNATEPVLRRVDDETMAFRHEAFRRAAYDSLTFQRRRELHGAVADHIAADPDPSDALLALHLDLAGRAHEAYPRAVAAGRAALASGALVEAAELLGRAAQLARTIDRRSFAGLLLDQGQTLSWLGDLEGAGACYRAAGRAVTDPLDHGRLCHLQADLALTHNQFRQAARWAARGLSLTAPFADSAVSIRCHLLLDLAARLDLSGRHQASLPLAEQALAMARSGNEPVLEGLAHLHLEMALSSLMSPDALPHGDAAIRIFEEIGHDGYLNAALCNSGLTAMYLGQWDDAIDRYRRAITHARMSGHTRDLATAEMNIGFLLFRQGHFEEADTQAVRALRTFATVGVILSVGLTRLLRGQIAAAEARFVDADRLVAEARDAFVEVADAGMIVDADVTALEHLVLAGRFTDAVESAGTLEGRLALAESEVPVTFGRVLGRAEAALGVEGGVARVERALALARRQHFRYDAYLCLATLVAIAEDGGPEVAPEIRAERDAIAADLGIVSAAGRVR